MRFLKNCRLPHSGQKRDFLFKSLSLLIHSFSTAACLLVFFTRNLANLVTLLPDFLSTTIYLLFRTFYICNVLLFRFLVHFHSLLSTTIYLLFRTFYICNVLLFRFLVHFHSLRIYVYETSCIYDRTMRTLVSFVFFSFNNSNDIPLGLFHLQ